MSRGPGRLQRSILGELLNRAGGDAVHDGVGGWVWLQADVHDLQAVSRTLARRHDAMLGPYPSSSWHAGFTRAVRGLQERGYIEVVSGLVPLAAADSDVQRTVHTLADGLYLDWGKRRRRFVRVANIS